MLIKKDHENRIIITGFINKKQLNQIDFKSLQHSHDDVYTQRQYQTNFKPTCKYVWAQTVMKLI